MFQDIKAYIFILCSIISFIKIPPYVTFVQWMVLGMSGPPGACAHPLVAAAIVIVPAHASSPRMAESLAVAPQSKPSSATLLFAQVSHEPLDCKCLFKCKYKKDIRNPHQISSTGLMFFYYRP